MLFILAIIIWQELVLFVTARKLIMMTIVDLKIWVFGIIGKVQICLLLICLCLSCELSQSLLKSGLAQSLLFIQKVILFLVRFICVTMRGEGRLTKDIVFIGFPVGINNVLCVNLISKC